MAGPVRNGMKGPTGDYAIDLANGWIQLRDSPAVAGAPQDGVFRSVSVGPNTPDARVIAAGSGLAETGPAWFDAAVVFAGSNIHKSFEQFQLGDGSSGSAPQLNLLGTNGWWQIDIDVAATIPYRDFTISRFIANRVVTDGVTTLGSTAIS